MKKILFSIFSLAIAAGANAQSEIKPNQGDVTTEFGLSGGVLNSNFELNEQGNLLRFRYFAKETLAFRLGFGLSSTKSTDNVYDTDDDSRKGTYKTGETDFLLNLGVEKHFTGTERLSPYVGGDLLLSVANEKTEFKNTSMSGNDYADGNSGSIKGPGSVGFGVRAVVGADYYIAKRVYLGAEAGFGFLSTKLGETKIKINDEPTVTEKSAGSGFELAPNVITGVRIGFVF
ncbi:hypothetical protein [Niabella aurantiaca]|uniref:hypothetical protein n=1 Tax=Niabella aurantiaca TaxID=379900 RepID=UPI00037CB650|nr:hypothetical protein [Niabella aurantiaca]